MNDDDVVIEQDGSEELAHDDELAGAKATDNLAKLKAELARTKEEKQEYLLGWQRAKADYVNVLKRLDDEKAGGVVKGAVSMAMPFIDVLDTIARAEEQGHVSSDFAPVVSQLRSAVASAGLSAIGAVGEAFDPQVHEALGEDKTDEADKDHTVSAVLQQGWKYKDTVIRPARVRVFSHT